MDPDFPGLPGSDPGFGFGSFDQTFQTMQTLFVVFFVVVLGLIVLAAVRGMRQWSKNQAAPEVSATARIADKRIALSGGGSTMMNDPTGSPGMISSSDPVSERHFVTFEQASGERFELEVPASEYGLLVVGDQGSVSMKGTRYLGFSRELMR